tara:strand:- start:330 stop:1058 length:729 start_codon:yes stop_codon:yes gene_type:complete
MATVDLGKIKQVFRGTYVNSTAYAVDDLVTYTDNNITSTYICTTASTGNAPSSGGTAHGSWAYVAKGVADPIPSQSGQSGKFLTTNGSALSFGEVSAGKLLKIHHATTGTTTNVTTPTRADTGLTVTFTPEALGSTFFVLAQQFGLNGVTNDQTLFNLYLMRSIAGGTATELEEWYYLGNHNSNHRAYHCSVLGYKDTPTYTSGQTLNYHVEVGFYTGNYNLNYSAQNGELKSTIYVYEMGA